MSSGRFKQKRFGGALIVDTILNFNRTLGSQQVPENLASLDPEAAKSIREGGYRGDFLAAIQRPEDSRVYSIFEKHWNQESALNQIYPIVVGIKMDDC